MPNFTGSKREFEVIIDALNGAITKGDRHIAEKLCDQLKRLLCIDNRRPFVGKITPLPSHWPTGFTKPDRKTNNWFKKPRETQDHLNNSTAQEKINNILEGLI